MTEGTTTNHYAYDGAGRLVSRTVGTATTSLAWDVSSNLVETTGAGGHLLYVYDASGQRVAKIQVGDATHTGAVTGYLGSTELTDANTATAANHTSDTQLVDTAFVTGTRYYSFGGATVAVRQWAEATATTPVTSTLSLMFGDEQGSATVMMQVAVASSGAMVLAKDMDPLVVTRNAYTPYGAVRGTDNLSIDHGWLNQVSDEASTGLVYLNARYYDTGTSRFVSPDPLMNPADPKTLDAFRYADNNPITYTDATGLAPNCPSYLTGVALANCQAYAQGTVNYFTGEPAGTTNTPTPSANPGGPGPESPPLSTELADLTGGGRDNDSAGNPSSPLNMGLCWLICRDFNGNHPDTTHHQDGDRIVESLKTSAAMQTYFRGLLEQRMRDGTLGVGSDAAGHWDHFSRV